MEKFHKSQCAKILLIVLLLLVCPLLSTSLRPLYLYLLFNLLVIALGAESGVLSAISRPPLDQADKKPAVVVVMTSTTTVSANQPLSNNHKLEPVTAPLEELEEVATECIKSGTDRAVLISARGVQRSVSEKKKQVPKLAAKIGEAVKKCPSMPSLFFIGGCDGDDEAAAGEEWEEEEEGEMGVPTKQELFAKAETFIGNFYKQLKIQREDSWKRIHGLYSRAF